MTKKFSIFIALSLASLFFLFSVTTRAAKSAEIQKFLSSAEVVARLSTHQLSRTPASIAFGVNNTDMDVRANDSPVVNQFSGTCSSFATASVMENIFRSQGNPKLVSHRDLWNQYGVYDADIAIKTASENFITELQYWPDFGERSTDYQEHRSLKISSTITHGYNFEGAIKALDQNHPLVIAVQVPADLTNCKPTISETSFRTKGNHVLAAVGYHLDPNVAGGGYFILKNSWGTECGDKGYHYYPFELCKRNDLYCYFIEVDAVESR